MNKAWLLLGCWGCAASAPAPPCVELGRMTPSGITLATEDNRCRELLAFAATVPREYNMDFSTWLNSVAGQRVDLMLQTMTALTSNQWQPMTFSREPADVPCGPGVALSDEAWSSSILSKVLSKRPPMFYVSLSVDVAGDEATITTYQDFNCDHQTATSSVVGKFQRNTNLLAGWNLVKPLTTAEIDE